MKRLIKILVWVLIIILFSIFTGAFIISYFYADEVKQLLVTELNKNINTKISVEEIDLSVLSKFPDASIIFNNVVILSSEGLKGNEFKGINTDTLLVAEKIYLQFNIFDIIRKKYIINAIEIYKGKANIFVDSSGNNNYDFWTSEENDSESSVEINLNEVIIKNVNILFRNASQKIEIKAGTRKISLSGNFKDENYSVKTSGNLRVDEFKIDNNNYISSNPLYISSGFNFSNDNYNITGGLVEMGKLKINLSGYFRFNPEFYIDIKLKGKDIDINSFISLLPKNIVNQLGTIKSNGNFYFDGAFIGEFTNTKSPKVNINFGVQNGDFKNSSGVSIKEFNCLGFYSNGEKSSQTTSLLKLDSITGIMNSSSFEGYYYLNNFINPTVDCKVNGTFDLNELAKLINSKDIKKLNGMANVNILFSGKLKEISGFTKDDYKKGAMAGTILLNNVNVEVDSDISPYNNINGHLSFRNNDLRIDSLSVNYRNHDFNLKGFFKNIGGYILDDNEVLNIDAFVICNKFDLNKFNSNNSTNNDNNIALPAQVKLNSRIQIKEFVYEKFKAENISGELKIEDNKLWLSEIKFLSCDGTILADGSMVIDSKNNLVTNLKADLKEVNVKKLFLSFDNFGQDFIEAKHLSGKLSTQINMQSVWDKNLSLVEDKLVVESKITIENGELIRFEPMLSLSDYIAVNELQHIKFSRLQNDILIKDKIIYIPKMDINTSAFNLEISGQHSFDNKIDYKLKIILSEWLAKNARQRKQEIEEFGEIEDDGLKRTNLFLSIKGTTDDYKITWDRKSTKENLKDNIRKEKETVKEILKEEFGGLFGKKDTATKQEKKPANNAITIEWN